MLIYLDQSYLGRDNRGAGSHNCEENRFTDMKYSAIIK